MLRTLDAITISAPYERVFHLAADVERWPSLLPHYRYVRRLSGGGDAGVYAMGASRSGIPVRWTAWQQCRAAACVIVYHHIAGVTRDMRVAWRFAPRGTDVDITLEHELRGGWPMVASRAGQVFVGELFVRHIAQQTLHGLKQVAEQGS